MADILPFRGIRYHEPRIGGDLAAVMAPPYDVISAAEQMELYDRHPNNVVRLILGREENRYESSARFFRDWLAENILVKDDVPSVYVYRQRFADPASGAVVPERVGLICLLRLEEYESGKVLPHENTLTAAKADRLNLLRASQAQFESIYGLYSDQDRSVEKFLAQCDIREPVIEHIDNLIGSSHNIERIADTGAIAVLQDLLRDKPIFIADGHHRYETSLNYRREVRAALSGQDTASIPADYILITLTAFEDEGLVVLPTHREIRGVPSDRIARLPELLSAHFTVTEADRADLEAEIEDAAKRGRKAIGMVLPDHRAYTATLNSGIDCIPELISGGQSDAAKCLDVTILQSLILDEILGISASDLAAGGNVGYTRDVHTAVDGVESGEYQVAFILGRPSVEDVRLVSLAHDKMPQKSTFFYPKLLSGLILRDLAAEAGDSAGGLL
ncbi:MAG: DUF1015 domain-containing protein [Capsulimonadaceae bacterium]